MIVSLIGYRGTGKSTIGPALARQLGWAFVDADDEIERRSGRTIREIFEQEGEAGFRARERMVMADLLQGDQLVLAAGGGVILDPQTRDELRAAGPVIWLRASVDTIAARLTSDPGTRDRRPSLTGDDHVQEISEVLNARMPLYEAASTSVIDTDDRDVSDIVDEILDGPLTGESAQ